MNKSLIGHVMCMECIWERFKGCRVIVIDPICEKTVLSAGRGIAALRDGEMSIYERMHDSLILDLRGGEKGWAKGSGCVGLWRCSGREESGREVKK